MSLLSHTSNRGRSLATLVWLLAGAGCGFETTRDVIEPPFGAYGYSCQEPVKTSFGSLEIGEMRSNDKGVPQFSAFSDGDVIHLRTGGQGASMIVMRFRVTGANAVPCATHRTQISHASGGVVSVNREPLALAPAGGGAAITADIFFPGDYSDQSGIIVETLVGSSSATRRLQVSPQ